MESGNSSLLFPAAAGDAQLVARLLGEGRDVNEANGAGCTALILASAKGQMEVVRLLLARKDVEVNKSATDGYTALMHASQKVTSKWCGSSSRARASRLTRPR